MRVLFLKMVREGSLVRRDSAAAPRAILRRIPIGVSILLLLLPGALFCQVSDQVSQLVEPGSPSRGEDLFMGRVRFRNGGPPCSACHNVSGLPFPSGGSLGPDLTKIYSKLGPLGIAPALQTLFFSAMTPIYDPHPLTPEERVNLRAFFREANSRGRSSVATPLILLIALGGFVVLIALTHFLWRNRLRSVRKRLVRRAMSSGGARS